MNTYRRAFTLIELLVVISIISLLASIIMASLSGALSKATTAAGLEFESEVYHTEGDQLVADWEFDDCSGSTALDDSGNGNIGTFSTAPAWSNSTPSGKGCAVSLNGTQYMSAGGPVFSSSAVTYSAWVYANTDGSSGEFSIFHDSHDGGNGILVHQTGFYANTIEFQMSVSGGQNYFQEPYTLPLKRWTQIVCVYDGTTGYVYVNGKLVGSGVPANTGAVTLVAPMYVGGNGPYGDAIDGLIDNARIYEKALVASDVQKLYAEEKEQFLAINT